MGAGDLRRRRRARSVGDGGGSTTRSVFTEVSSVLEQSPSSRAGFEVVLSDGTRVRVPEQFDAGSLRSLLETLRGC